MCAEAAHATDRFHAPRAPHEAAIPVATLIATTILSAPGIFDPRPRWRCESQKGCDCGNSCISGGQLIVGNIG
jgi:hypothetical protein